MQDNKSVTKLIMISQESTTKDVKLVGRLNLLQFQLNFAFCCYLHQ